MEKNDDKSFLAPEDSQYGLLYEPLRPKFFFLCQRVRVVPLFLTQAHRGKTMVSQLINILN